MPLGILMTTPYFALLRTALRLCFGGRHPSLCALLVNRSETIRSSSPSGRRAKDGGEGGIRTPGALRLSGFQDRRVKPLCHLSLWYARGGHVGRLEKLIQTRQAHFVRVQEAVPWGGLSMGISNQKRLPLLGVLCTPIRPPWASTASWQKVRPSPVE